MKNVFLVVLLLFVFGLIGVHSAHAEVFAVNGQATDQSGTAVADSLEPLDAVGRLNFDDMAPCFFSQTIPVPQDFYKRYGFILKGPATKDPNANVTNGGAILNECGGFNVTGHSSPNFLAFDCQATLSNGGSPFLPEKIIFITPVSGVSLNVGSFASAGQSVTFTAKTALGKTVDTETVVLAPAMTSVNLTSLKSNIKKVLVTLPVESTACVFVIDDIETTP
jgi:hypothetical protein